VAERDATGEGEEQFSVVHGCVGVGMGVMVVGGGSGFVAILASNVTFPFNFECSVRQLTGKYIEGGQLLSSNPYVFEHPEFSTLQKRGNGYFHSNP
jgi:hypothetical protein